MAIKLEIWADNLFEAKWALEDIQKKAADVGWTGTMSEIQGFIPQLHLQKGNMAACITGFGDYRTWHHLPNELAELLKSGKVDIIPWDPLHGKALIAIEDTSATPTGNQPLQRGERFVAAATKRIPVIYLLPAAALKFSDGNVRSPNIWMPICALQLIARYRSIALTMWFGDKHNADDKTVGSGQERMQEMMWAAILGAIGETNEN